MGSDIEDASKDEEPSDKVPDVCSLRTVRDEIFKEGPRDLVGMKIHQGMAGNRGRGR